MQHKLNPEQGKPHSDLQFLFSSLQEFLCSKSFHLSSLCIHCHSFPGSGSLKPQREAPGAAWRTEAGSGTADLNLMRMNLMSRTHQIQVDDETELNQMSCETTNFQNRLLFWSERVLFFLSCVQVQAGRQISGTLEGLQHPKPQQGGIAQLGEEQRRRELAGPTSLSSSLFPGEEKIC